MTHVPVLKCPGGGEPYEVRARGELQLAVLIEGLRRDGMELTVSPPQVLMRWAGMVSLPFKLGRSLISLP